SSRCRQHSFAGRDSGDDAAGINTRDLLIIGGPVEGYACARIAIVNARHRIELNGATGDEWCRDRRDLNRLNARHFHHESRESRRAADNRAYCYFTGPEKLHVSVVIHRGDIEWTSEVSRWLFFDDVTGGVHAYGRYSYL